MCEAITPDAWYSGVSLSEVLRYAGVRDERRCGEELRQEAARAVEEIGACAAPKQIVRECTVTVAEEGCVLDGIAVNSRDLAAHLRDCRRALLFAATLGSGVDMRIMRWSAVKMSYAVLLQAAAAALIEAYCDNACAALAERYATEGGFLLPRYSPGYGDFSLAYQKPLLEYMNAYKYAGITVSGGGQMTPMKTVSAVIGIAHEQPKDGGNACGGGKCARCPHTTCAFRNVSNQTDGGTNDESQG